MQKSCLATFPTWIFPGIWQMALKHAGSGQRKSVSECFAQSLCGYQAIDSFMKNPQDTLFLEAKALELVALQLRLLDHLTGKIPQRQFAGHHADKISYACEILKKEMVNPPRILSLARRMGLNHNHLIQGFKQTL